MPCILEVARRAARTDVPVLLLGETGTGKEVLARSIHQWSSRRSRSFVCVNAAALPEELFEAELFGFVTGAFSGAGRPRLGRFGAADGGTLLLDEVAEIPLPLQAKLLRVLQDGCYQAVGSDSDRHVDVRVLAATNRDLDLAQREGRFRTDLYHRLNVVPLELPPLRERKDELLDIAEELLEEIAQETGQGPFRLSRVSCERLLAHDWPGNIRELRNVLTRAGILAKGPVLEVELPPTRRPRAAPRSDWPTFDAYMRSYIEDVLRLTRGRIYGAGGAAAILGMPPTTLQSRIQRLGIEKRELSRSL